MLLLWAAVAVLALIALFFLFWRLWFLRQPKRATPSQGVVSPASGKLVRIVEYENGKAQGIPKGLLGWVRQTTRDIAPSGTILVIMLSPLDVHYQRAPVSGTIERVQYTKGRFANAVLGASKLKAFENEKNEIVINTGKERVKVVQVAGVLARRISCFVEPGQRVRKGEVIGLINLGSQVHLVLPRSKVKAREGMRVVDGETVLA